MPVFTRLRDGVLTLTVDGDFTANELRREAFRALESPDTPSTVPILLDMSGAAGLSTKSTEEFEATGAIFGAYRDRISALAVVAPAEVHPHFGEGGIVAREAGITVHACLAHSEARNRLGVERKR